MNLADARFAATRLMVQHGLYDWTFQFSRARKTFGKCLYGKKQIRLSRPLTELNDEAQVLDTIKHEIAHALAGFTARHGHRWKAMAVAVGAKPERCYDHATVVAVQGRYQAVCNGCDRTYHRFRMPHTKRQACTPCCRKHNGGKFDPRFALEWRVRGT